MAIGNRNLKKIYSYREMRRKQMHGLIQEYMGEDRKVLHALGKLWLRALDHTLWEVHHRSTVYFAPELQLYELGTVGLCYEWHDFATFAQIANALPGYDHWVELLETDELAARTFYLRPKPNCGDPLMRPTSTMFYSIAFTSLTT